MSHVRFDDYEGKEEKIKASVLAVQNWFYPSNWLTSLSVQADAGEAL